MKREWVKIKGLGQLYLENILLSFDVPILFVCTDFENRRYLCLNIDDDTPQAVIAEIDVKALIGMLKDEITMEMAFRDSVNGKIVIATYDSSSKQISTSVVNSQIISEDFLPEKGAFFELKNKKITDYIEFLSKQIISVEPELIFEKKGIVIKAIKYQAYFSLPESKRNKCNNVSLGDTIKQCSYNIEYNKKMIA